jgi:uridylate kinase
VKRVLLKFSGEALMGQSSIGYEPTCLKGLSERLFHLYESGVQIGLVVGGGNLFRGVSGNQSLHIERSVADQAGMLATMMNGLILSQTISQLGAKVKLFSSFSCPSIADEYRLDRVLEALETSIVIFVGGTGHPYFTTDTAAALRAAEIKADMLVKLTQVQGVYDKDPRIHSDALFLPQLSYLDFLQKKLAVMDLTALTLCMHHQIPIRICHIHAGSFKDALAGKFGTLISEK